MTKNSTFENWLKSALRKSKDYLVWCPSVFCIRVGFFNILQRDVYRPTPWPLQNTEKLFRTSAIRDNISKERKYAGRKLTGKKWISYCVLWLQHLSKGCNLEIFMMVGDVKNWFALILSFYTESVSSAFSFLSRISWDFYHFDTSERTRDVWFQCRSPIWKWKEIQTFSGCFSVYF